jgi:tripartite-type tricarboxylate transporter receptor subunit TctC
MMAKDRRRAIADYSRKHATLLIALALLTAPKVTFAQYPTRPVTIVVSSSAGSAPDIQARIVARKLNESWGEPVVVENVPGSAGNIAAERVAKASPDGYTIFYAGAGPLYFNRTLYRNLRYDIERDFEPVIQVGRSANILVVHPSMPVRSVKELVAYGRARPGQLRYGSVGSGSSMHICTEMLKQLTGLDAVHVPYKSAPQMATDLIAGQFEFAFHNAAVVLPYIRSGKLRALATTTRDRFFAIPDVPTMAEAGVEGIVYDGGTGLLVPKGTPAPVVRAIYREAARALQAAEVKQVLTSSGTEPVGASPADFRTRIHEENLRWAPIVRASGASLD